MVTLRDITRENWKQVIRLQPGENQKNFVASNIYSLAQSKYEPEYVPKAIYAGEESVGFIMYGLDSDDGYFWITRLMVDQKHQGKGYGRAALQQIIDTLEQIPGCDRIMISYVPGNTGAEKLYESLGFRKTGEIIEGEIISCLRLDPKVTL